MRYSSQNARVELLGRERALERFPVPSRGSVRTAAVYPASYRIGMSNLGFHFLFRALSASGRLKVERAFRDTMPVTLESGSRLSEFPIIFFSVSYEEDYINLVKMLVESGIEPMRERRAGSPCIVAGGAAVSGNPFPLLDIADILSLGEGEVPLAAITDLLDRGVSHSAAELIAEISGRSGLLSGREEGSFADKTPREGFARSAILTPSTVFPDTILVESSRGCPGRCAFCLARSIYHPYRPLPSRSLDRLVADAPVPVGRVGLVSTAVAAHPEFSKIVDSLLDRGIEVSFSSLRAEDIDEGRAEAISRARTRSVSLAPESGSEAVRFALGKRVGDQTYIEAARLLGRAGVRNLTLYLLIGTPWGLDRSMDETKLFLRAFKEASGGMKIEVHANPLVPKAWTPMQYHAMPRRRELEREMSRLRDICAECGLRFKGKSIRSVVVF